MNNTGMESNDSGWDASESDLSPEAASSYESLDGRTESNPTSCRSSTGSDLSYTSVASFYGSQRRFAPAIAPDPPSEHHDEFQHTTVTPICYRETIDTNSKTQGAVDSRQSHGSDLFRSEDYGLGRNSDLRNPGFRQKNFRDTVRSGRFAIKESAFGKDDDRVNVSNNDNDCELQGSRWRSSDRRRNFDAVVMPCCDEPQQNFYFEQNRFPPGCLDIVLNGNDRPCESSDNCSDIYRGSGCESDDTTTRCFRSSTSGFGTADQCSRRSWDSLHSFEGSEGLDEVLTTRSDPGDCFEDELIRGDVDLLPVSVSLESVSSSVGVDVRCAEGVLCVDTALSNSNDDEEDAMVDMTVSARDCSCSEDDGGNHYDVDLINNYIRSCSDYVRRNDETTRLKHPFDTTNVTGRGFGWESTCGRADGATLRGKRIMALEEEDVCWNSGDERKMGRRQSKSSLSSAPTDKRRRVRRSSRERHRTHSRHRKSNRKSSKQVTDDTRKKRHRKSVANIEHKKSSKKSAAHAQETLSRRTQSKRSNTARKRSSCKGATEVSQKKSVRGCVDICCDWANTNDRRPDHTASCRQRTSAARRQRSSLKGELYDSRQTSVARRFESSEYGGEGKRRRVSKRSTSSQQPVSSAKNSRTGNSRTDVSTSRSAIDTHGSSQDVTTDSHRHGTPYSSNSQRSVRREQTHGARGQTSTSRASNRSVAKSSHRNPNPNNLPSTKDLQREVASLATAASNKSKSAIAPVCKAASAPATLGKNKSNTKRAFRVETMRLKGPDNRPTYHEPEEAVEDSAQAVAAPQPVANQQIVQASANYHETDLIVMSISIPSKPKGYGPVSDTYLPAGEFFGKPFRHIPYLFPMRAIVCYEDDHGLQRNRTTSTVQRRFNRAMTQSNPAFVERVRLIPSVRSSRAAVQQPIGELTSPLSLASTRYLDAVMEQGEELFRVPPAEVQFAPSSSPSIIGFIDSVTMPQQMLSTEQSDQSVASPRRKQSVSFADMSPGFDGDTSMYPPYFPEGNKRDELYLNPSVPIPELPELPDDALLEPSELLTRVAAASDRDLLRPSLLPRPKSDAIGTSVTQVVSRWRKHYMDNDPCFPKQETTNTWLRSLNSKSIQFNDDAVVCRPTKLRDCRSVETNKIIYYEKSVEPTSSQLGCNCPCDCDEFFDSSRLPFRRSSDSASTVSSACCHCRPLNISSSSSIGDSRGWRFSSSHRSVDSVMDVLSSSMSNRFDEGDRSDSSGFLSGPSYSSSGSRSQTESDEQEKFYVESLLAEVRASARDFMTDIVAREAVLQQQHRQQRQKQHQQQQQCQQQQQQPQQQQQQQQCRQQQQQPQQQQRPQQQHQQRQHKQPFQSQAQRQPQQKRQQHQQNQQQHQQQLEQQFQQQLLQQWEQEQGQQQRSSLQQQEGLSESILTDSSKTRP